MNSGRGREPWEQRDNYPSNLKRQGTAPHFLQCSSFFQDLGQGVKMKCNRILGRGKQSDMILLWTLLILSLMLQFKVPVPLRV